MNKSYAVIPARGGSKRIPNKNIQEINGMPLISFPITAALGSQEFADVFVSTDSKEIAEISVAHGASVPFIRDSKLSDDLTPTIPVVRDAISRIASLADEDIICCIYPTSISYSEGTPQRRPWATQFCGTREFEHSIPRLGAIIS